MKNILRKLAPDSFLIQLLLIIGIGLVMLQGINLLVIKKIQVDYFRQTHYDRVRKVAAHYFSIRRLNPEQRAKAVESSNQSHEDEIWNTVLTIRPNLDGWPAQDDSERIKETLGRLSELIRSRGRVSGLEIRARILKSNDILKTSEYIKNSLAGRSNVSFPLLETAVRLPDGYWMNTLQPLGFNETEIVWIQRIQLIAISVTFLALLSLILAKVTKPIRRLGKTFDRFGRQPEVMRPLPETGTREVREATRSFNLMRLADK